MPGFAQKRLDLKSQPLPRAIHLTCYKAQVVRDLGLADLEPNIPY